MITRLKLKFGKVPSQPAQVIDITPVTIFVGPNNSGKSKVLQEIARFVREGTRNTNDVVLDEIHLEDLSRDAAETRVRAVTLKPRAEDTIRPEHILVGKQGSRVHVHYEQLIQALMGASTDPSLTSRACQWYLAYNTLILDGHSRISLVNEQAAGDLQAPPQTGFQTLFHDDAKRSELRRIIHDAFKSYLVVDPTKLGWFRLRLSAVEPSSMDVERGIDDKAVRFHAAATPIEQGSDGLKAFTGMMSEIIAGDPQVLLIDEPEAFLHPALASLLGKEVAHASVKAAKRLFVSTHSPQFVMGCVQSGAPITIVRLTYRDGVATARVLESDDILRLMRNPLLRSTGVLAGLFYECVVVTESDADRAFYQEINERLLQEKQQWGIPNCLFINAQNKQTVPAIVKPLRELGIPAAGIVDVDVLKEGGKVWSTILDSTFLPELERSSTATLRAAAKEKLDSTGKEMKNGGVNLLDASDRTAVESLFEKLAQYGLFVVPGGELESWLKGLGATGHSPQWLIQMFEKLGEDPSDHAYQHPGDDDVWQFIASINSWFANQSRRGIPT